MKHTSQVTLSRWADAAWGCTFGSWAAILLPAPADGFVALTLLLLAACLWFTVAMHLDDTDP